MKNLICNKCPLFLKHKNLFLYSLTGIKNRHHLYKVCPALELKISNDQYEKYKKFIKETNIINRIHFYDDYIDEEDRNQFKQKMIRYHFFDNIEEEDIKENCILYPEWMVYFLSQKVIHDK